MQLSKVVGAILNDLSAAQDLANEYSNQISYKYKKHQVIGKDDNILSNFPLPSAMLFKVSLDLKFIIKDINEDGLALDIEKTQKNCQTIAQTTVKFLASSLNKDSNSSAKPEESENKSSENSLVDTRIVTPQLSEKLAIRVAQELFRLCHKVFLLGSDLTESEITETITEQLKDELLNHFDNQEERDSFKDAILQDCAVRATKEADIPNIIQKVKGSPNTDVIVSAIALNKVPVETIQSLRISAKYNDSRWTILAGESTVS